MRTGFMVLATSLAVIGCARGQTPEPSDSPIEIADGRSTEGPPDLSAWTSNATLQRAFGAARTYWAAKDPSYSEDIRVFGVADGAFTAPGAKQHAVLYVMSLEPRCCVKTGLAVLQDGKVVRNIAFEGIAQDLRAVPDLDGDGLDELVTVGSFGMGGQESSSFTLVSFTADGVVDRSGPSIYDSSCGAGQPGSTAARVTAVPGPTFTAERFTQPDCESAEWQPDGAPETIQLDQASGTEYVEVPVR